MIHFKNISNKLLCFKWKIKFNTYKKASVHFSDYVKIQNKYPINKITPAFFSTSKNSDYINYINDINSFLDIFQKNLESTSNNENIVSVLQKIKNEKKYEENEDILEIISSIKLLIEKRVRPIILNDGGDIKFICFDIDSGIVYVQLEGACVTCSQSEMTLQYMIKNMLTYYISEIKEIKNVTKNGDII
ncbi:NifU-like protein, putative [Plasmodium gallinaceum]|uniref:NifU-like protein, putative n=1 Tax=Plasmodium gallinaceum TaxID=5849 RepID=A0A1J1GZY6_PLAGA|nr:NifU-like protein, putative [Plasmodium gallinaceum]CRG96858.1 NifU-like protein, putative [Plasmodium gallinaceum]